MTEEHPFASIETAFKRSVAALNDSGVPYLLGGGLAAWAHGGPETRNDLDFMVRPDDAEQALQALVDAGMRPERPPEDWLLKAWDGDVLVDLIHHPTGLEITDEVLERGELMDVAAMTVRVLAAEDVVVTKLLALGEHALDLEPSLQIARSLREKVDWGAVRARTMHSPYARAFLALASDLGVTTQAPVADRPPGAPRVRVVE